jgi:hypothetical protein
MDFTKRLIIVAMDVLLLVELTVCMYLGREAAENFTAFFMTTYLPAAAVTVLAAWLLIRRRRHMRQAVKSAATGKAL